MTTTLDARLSRSTVTNVPTLPAWAWLHAPLALFVLLHAASAFAPDFYRQWVIPEDGLVEWLTPLVLISAFSIALSLLRRAPRGLRTWLVLFAIGCFYFAGEEVSWGQRLFGWATPEPWQAINKQSETNLHNLSGLLDSKPRLLLSIGMLIGGIVYPLSSRARRILDRIIPTRFWPTRVCTPAAVLALLAGTPARILELSSITPPAVLAIGEPGEVKELYIALFLLLYITALARRETRTPALP
jgi:hypothetical protein